jgi:hypothetical protein
MKIAFIFNDSHNKEWSTPGGLSLALKNLGHKVDHYDLRDACDVLTASKQHSNYDAVCLFEAGTIPEEIQKIWSKENFKHTLMIAEGGDDPQIYHYNRYHTIPADVVITPDWESFNAYKNLGKSAYWFTHWGDESIWHRTAPIDSGVVSTTAGPRFGMWPDCMKSLINNFGLKFKNPRLDNSAYLSPQKNAELYAESDVIVQVSSCREITRRIFEASICERAIVTDRLPANRMLQNCFTEDEHIMLFDTPDECVEKVKMLLGDSNKRKNMARAAYEHTKKLHSAKSRAKTLIEIITENS